MKTLLATMFCLIPLSTAYADASAPACLPVAPDGKPVLNFEQPDVSDAQVRSVVTNAVIPA